MPVPSGISDVVARWRSNESRTLYERFDAQHNSLSLARFFFAALVVVSHSFPLGGFHGNTDPWAIWSEGQVDLGTIAVEAFFLIQMMLAEFGIFQTGYRNSRISALGFIALSLVLSAAMGYVSWHGSEKHVLRLKKRWPHRTAQSVL